MKSPNQKETYTTPKIVVELSQVEKELAALQRKAVTGVDYKTSTTFSRVLVANMLVYSSPEKVEEINDVLSTIASEYPMRTIIVSECQAKQCDLKADVSMICGLGEGARTLCGEEIHIRVSTLDESFLGAIIPMFVADIPLYFWTPILIDKNNSAFQELLRLSDYWIYDSSQFVRNIDDLNFIISLIKDNRFGPSPRDFSWLHLNSWREAVAGHFDSELSRKYLNGIDEINIYGCQPGHNSPNLPSLLAASWLARQLELEIEGLQKLENSLRIITRCDNKIVNINLVNYQKVPFDINKIEITACAGETTARFSAEMISENEIELAVDADDLPRSRQVHTFSGVSNVEIIKNIFESRGKDSVYGGSLNKLKQIMEIMR